MDGMMEAADNMHYEEAVGMEGTPTQPWKKMNAEEHAAFKAKLLKWNANVLNENEVSKSALGRYLLNEAKDTGPNPNRIPTRTRTRTRTLNPDPFSSLGRFESAAGIYQHALDQGIPALPRRLPGVPRSRKRCFWNDQRCEQVSLKCIGSI
jgi:hypothetical protein